MRHMDRRDRAAEREPFEGGLRARGEPAPRCRGGEVLDAKRTPGLHDEAAPRRVEALAQRRHLEHPVPERHGAGPVAVPAARIHVDLRVRVDAAVELREGPRDEGHRRVGAQVRGVDHDLQGRRRIEMGCEGCAPRHGSPELGRRVAVDLLEPHLCGERSFQDGHAHLPARERGVSEDEAVEAEVGLQARRAVEVPEGNLAAHAAPEGQPQHGACGVQREGLNRDVAGRFPRGRLARHRLRRGRRDGHAGLHHGAAVAAGDEVHVGLLSIVGEPGVDVCACRRRGSSRAQVGPPRAQREPRSAHRPSEVGRELDVARERQRAERGRERGEGSTRHRQARLERRVAEPRQEPVGGPGEIVHRDARGRLQRRQRALMVADRRFQVRAAGGVDLRGEDSVQPCAGPASRAGGDRQPLGMADERDGGAPRDGRARGVAREEEPALGALDGPRVTGEQRHQPVEIHRAADRDLAGRGPPRGGLRRGLSDRDVGGDDLDATCLAEARDHGGVEVRGRLRGGHVRAPRQAHGVRLVVDLGCQIGLSPRAARVGADRREPIPAGARVGAQEPRDEVRRRERPLRRAGDDAAREPHTPDLDAGDHDLGGGGDLRRREVHAALGHQMGVAAAERSHARDRVQIGDGGVHLQGELVRSERELHQGGRTLLRDLGRPAHRPPGQLAADARGGHLQIAHAADLARKVEGPRELGGGGGAHGDVEHGRQAGRGSASRQEAQVEGARLDRRRGCEVRPRRRRPRRGRGSRELSVAHPGVDAGHDLLTTQLAGDPDRDLPHPTLGLGGGDPRARTERPRQPVQLRVDRGHAWQVTVDPCVPELDVRQRDLDLATRRRVVRGGLAGLERFAQAQLARSVLLEGDVRIVACELGDAHEHRPPAGERAQRCQDVEPRAHAAELEHAPARWIEDLDVNPTDPIEAEQADALEGDPPGERRGEGAVHPRLHEATRRREPEVQERAAQGRQREHDGERGGPGDGGEAHQKASPRPNANAIGTPERVPGSASTCGSVPLATWSPGIR